MLLGFTVTSVVNTTLTYKPWDPFEILGVSTFASEKEITKMYRKLGRKYHPDKAEDKETAQAMFVNISKAYQALTDPLARKNYEEYGNVDGPRQQSLGIALPSWLVDKKYSYLVLLAYLLAFGLGVPFVVSKSWSQGKLYTKDKILHTTMGLYFQQMKEAMSLKKVFELLAGSLEYKSEIKMRPSDARALQELLDDIAGQVQEAGGEKYERPKSLTEDWQLKAHLLLFAHFNRLSVSNADLKGDQEEIVAKACHLALGMLQIALARQWLQTASQCISLVQCLVQAVWEGHSSLLQLPHVDGAIIKYAKTRKSPIRTVRQLVEMPEEDRRGMLRSLTDEQYGKLVAVAKTFPEAVLDSASFVTLGQPHVIPGGLITVKIKLRLVRAGEPLGTASSGDQEDYDVDNFEFDEDGNMIDPSAKLGASATADVSPVYCPRFPKVAPPLHLYPDPNPSQ